jgi:hypothetical protein
MSTETKLRRGTAAQCAAGTPAEGEVWVDLTNDRVRLGDGLLAGGHQIPNAVDVQKGSFNTVNAGGTANAITATLDPVPLSYFTNMTVIIKAGTTNTGAATLNVNGLGVRNIFKVSSGALGALAAGDLTAGAYYTVRYDGTQFVLEGSAGGVSSVTGSAGIVVTPTTGSPNVSIDTNNALGVGAHAILRNNSSSIAAGATSSSLNLTTINASGAVQNTGVSAGGTWRNISGQAVITSAFGLFIRVS